MLLCLFILWTKVVQLVCPPLAVRVSEWASLSSSFILFCQAGFLFLQDGGLLINNPTALAIHECRCLWPNTPLQCVLSLGTGRYETVGKNSTAYTSLKTKLTNVISSATDTEGKAAKHGGPDEPSETSAVTESRFRGAHHARCPPAPRHLLPLQPPHERGRPVGREPRGEAQLPEGRGGALLGAQRGQAEEGGPGAVPGEEQHSEAGRVDQAQDWHVWRRPVCLQTVAVSLGELGVSLHREWMLKRDH